MELFASTDGLLARLAYHGASRPVCRSRSASSRNKKTDDGGDYYKISAKGYVPALRLDDGQVLNEGPSVAAVSGRRRAQVGAGAGPGAPSSATQLIDMLNYLSTELHKRIFYKRVQTPPRRSRPRQAARALFEPTFDHLSNRLGGSDYLVGNSFTRGRCLPGDDAELGRLPQGRPRQVADPRRLPPEAPQAPVGRPRRWASRWPSASARAA